MQDFEGDFISSQSITSIHSNIQSIITFNKCDMYNIKYICIQMCVVFSKCEEHFENTTHICVYIYDQVMIT